MGIVVAFFKTILVWAGPMVVTWASEEIKDQVLAWQRREKKARDDARVRAAQAETEKATTPAEREHAATSTADNW